MDYREYSEEKITSNIDSEVFNVCSDEAHDSYSEDIILETANNDINDIELNIEKIISFIKINNLG